MFTLATSLSNQRQFAATLVLGSLLAFTGVSCAGNTLGRVTSSDELPKELPSEMKQKFEVQDQLAKATPAPLPVVIPPAPTKKKKSKKAKLGAVTPKATVPEPGPSPAPTPYVYVSRRPAKEPIWVGEKMVFDITYFGMSAGDFTVEALPLKAMDGRQVYHIRGTAISSKVFSLFYRLNDTVETFIDYESVFSHRFHIILDESKQSRDALELYDPEKSQTYYWNRWNHKERGFSENKEYQPIAPLSQDSLSALYFLRTVPLPDGAVITIPVVSEGKSWEAVVTVMRREMVSAPWGKVQAVVLKPETKFQGVLKKQGDSFIWLSDDDRRIILRLEAKVRIGTVVANLKKFDPGTPP
jgi:hypothetical protein